MMSSTPVSAGIKEVLNTLDDEQLFGLARTTTQGLLKGTINSREDAIDIILKYSTNEVSILRRRVITRDVLFSYLHNKNIPVAVPTTKDKLIDHICSLWNIQNQEIPSNQAITEKAEDENDVNAMATQFSQWFYEMMNRDEVLETSHFFSDAALNITMTCGDNVITEDVCLPEEIVKLLYKTKIEHNLYFNPNLSSEGVRGFVDPHGLVIILSCGTLHSSNACVGVFEQMFSLARDPMSENNWKVKMTKLNLRSKPVLEEPTLREGHFSSALVPVKRED